MEDVPAVIHISTIFISDQSEVPSKIIFCGRDVLLHQVVDEFMGGGATDSKKEKILPGDRVPITRPSVKVVSSENYGWMHTFCAGMAPKARGSAPAAS